jgi:integrase
MIASFDDAVQFAEDTLGRLTNGIGSEGLKPHEVVEYKTLKAKIGADTSLLAEFEKFLSQRFPATREGLLLKDAVADYIKWQEEAGRSERNKETVRSHLMRWLIAFPNRAASSIQATEVSEYLRAIPGVSNRTRNNIRTSIVAFLNHAAKQRSVRKGIGEDILRFENEASDPDPFTPDELEKLLANADEKIVPYLAICAFAGTRSAEACRLRWENIDFEEKLVRLTSEITKNKYRRAPQLHPTLEAWLLLTPKEERTGAIVVGRPHKLTAKAAKKAGVGWRDNGLRAGCISYLMAIHENAAMVAERSGNSEGEVQRSYKALKSKKDAEKWFSILPTKR